MAMYLHNSCDFCESYRPSSKLYNALVTSDISVVSFLFEFPDRPSKVTQSNSRFHRNTVFNKFYYDKVKTFFSEDIKEISIDSKIGLIHAYLVQGDADVCQLKGHFWYSTIHNWTLRKEAQLQP